MRVHGVILELIGDSLHVSGRTFGRFLLIKV